MFGEVYGWIRRQVGQRSDTASATGSVHAKIKELRDSQVGTDADVSSASGSLHAKMKDLKASNKIKSIQRGTIALPQNGSDLVATATVTAVTTAKTELRLLGQSSVYNAPNARIVLTDTTTITATKGATGSEVIAVSYELTEYI